jgi:hypothetical protein
LTNEEEIQLFNQVGADLHGVIFKNAYDGEALDEEKFEITLKSLMFFTIKMVYDQQIPSATMIAYVRGVYEDLNRIAEGRDERAETIATLTEQ